MTWVEIGTETPLEWRIWLADYIGKYSIDWTWNDDSCGHYFLCFVKAEDATAFKLRFGL